MTAPAHPWRAELGAMLRLAGPLAVANLLQMLVYAIDVVFVARLGPEALAAASLSVNLFGLIVWSSSAMVGVVTALIAAELGGTAAMPCARCGARCGWRYGWRWRWGWRG